MKKFALIVSLLLAFLFTAANASAQTQTKTHTIDEYYQYVGPDIDVQGGLGYHWDPVNSSRDSVVGSGRLRGGVMWAPAYPWVFSAGPTLEITIPGSSSVPNYTSVVWGAQLEVLNWGAGLWLRAGMGVDYQVHPHYNAAVGWSVFGIEVQGFNASALDDRSGFMVLGTIRVPIGFIMYVMKKLH